MSFLAVSWFQLLFYYYFFLLFENYPQEICSYPSIKFLYLHGNGIYQVQEVDKLTSLTNLQDLTLHGNPIVEEGGYRQYVLSKLPGLKNLDFSVVTKADRNDAITWGKMYGKRRRGKKKKSQEDGWRDNWRFEWAKNINVEMGVWTFLKWRGCGLWLS